MIPSVLASRFREGLKDYMETSYPITSPIFENSLHRFLEKEDAFFHEPYVSVKLPFRVAEHGNERFEAIFSDYSPYVHQNKAYDRLVGEDPQSTLVATGTGSGKTECFLYPILEYCYQHRGEPGIKALIIYPMNALATDQAKRTAEEIYKSPKLKGNVTAGMYVGGFSSEDTKGMSSEMVITDHQTLLENPPDILMTNYKMLDYLLVQPKNATLWAANDNPDTLRFIIVDELHTFDGAQGTDLACLIRRLKSRLKIPNGYMCCIGTSATMGGPDSKAAMIEYAQEIFGEPFEDDSIITEDRLSSHEFLYGREISCFKMPDRDDAEKLHELSDEENEEGYLSYAAKCWFDEEHQIKDLFSKDGRIELADHLLSHSFFQSMIGIIGSRIMQPEMICDELSQVYDVMQGTTGITLLESVLALISHARIRDVKGKSRPFLQVQVQLWMRELTRMRAKIDTKEAEFLLDSDLNQDMADKHQHYLPVVNCHDCGATGWVGIIDEVGQLGIKDIKVFHNKFFDGDKQIRMAFPRREGETGGLSMTKAWLCPECKYAQVDQGDDKCASCGHETVPIWLVRPEVEGRQKSYVCPFCGGKNSIILIGLRSATAISAGVGQIFGTRFNDDKKLLAFNDNVQDASHRAGFINARTWRMMLRTAMQHFVKDGGEGLTVSSFGTAMNEYWLNKLGEEAWMDAFIPFDMAGDRCYEELQKTGNFADDAAKNNLIWQIKQRIALETILEYGISSRVGRTLEKNASSMIAADMARISEVARMALPAIENEAGIRDIDEKMLIRYILGVLRHLRVQGAFALDIYQGFVQAGAVPFVLTKSRYWMSKALYKMPRFPSNSTDGDFEKLNAECWYIKKFSHLIDKTPLECPGIKTAVEILLKTMEEKKILVAMAGPKGSFVYGLNAEIFKVTTNVSSVRCDVCGQIIQVEGEQQDLWEGAVCTREGCMGHMHAVKNPPSCYSSLYDNGDLVRVHAQEHTGLLERAEREELEINFKHKGTAHKPWDPNLLSCTPTLEMGIDIGDLSTVVLCSVPPAQANYVQRIGRAGRTDGNAMTITVASSKAHDLYFYQEPMDMINGQVNPPGVFLDASAVLERQFVAFCFDNWVRSGIPESAVPTQLEQILSKYSPNVRIKAGFPFSFLDYTKAHLSQTIRMFKAMFNEGEVVDETLKRIETFAKGTGQEDMTAKITTAFKLQYDERQRLRNDISKLNAAIKALKDKPKDASFDEKIKDLEQERDGLASVVRRINDKNTYEFLSDEGFLPNYAFPESGVVLKAILNRRTTDIAEDGTRSYSYEKFTKEYTRAAASAITEFAPDNSFYANGHKLVVDQVDVSKDDEAEQWRFCPDCNHMALNSTLTNVASCPVCGSVGWADQGQVRTMRRVRTLYATMPYEASRTGDESDNRTIKYYSNQMLVDINDTDIERGYQATGGKTAFGFEYVKKATMREINFGESDNIGTRLAIAGREEVRNGFMICRFCGKIQKRGKNAKPIHSSICRANTQNMKDPFEECMFLYRQFTSEAIRILMPSTTLDSTSKKMESFAAAIMLGLRLRFSNVDHLRFCVMDAPVPDAGFRKQYMVIYDSVPGGTGYLKQLVSTPDALMEVFQLSLDAMEKCSCALDDKKDGCYHCLYGYRQSNQINDISRKTAVGLLREILEMKDSLEEIESVSKIIINTNFDSELEKRFIEAISQSSISGRPVTMTKTNVNGKEGYFLEIGECNWDIEPQVDFDSSMGNPVPSRPDFVFHPRTKGTKQRTVAVFTDGFTYHGDKIEVDTNKRLAIRDVFGLPVWSITWKDVQDRLTSSVDTFSSSMLDASSMPGTKDFERVLQKNHETDWKIKNLSSFELLLRYLADPQADDHFTHYAEALTIGMLEQQRSVKAEEFTIWNKDFTYFSQLHESEEKPEYRKTVFGTWEPYENVRMSVSTPIAKVKAMQTADGKRIPVFDETDCPIIGYLDDTATDDKDKYIEAWRNYLYCMNMMQFAPKQVFVTQKGLESEIYDWYAKRHRHKDDSSIHVDSKWDEIINEELYDPACVELAKAMQDKGRKAPDEVGMEADDGCVLAEMAWTEDRIAVQLECQDEFRERLTADGWKVYSVTDPAVIDAIKEV